ncbi:hypothetical protein KC19_8G160300 [Ceratodon purpureus]|uniref:Uncharacterized protein n=1 Tax=Ceratodon purpureus TaxID=3225 RepID=A0A8T0GZ18_CERPU|nr:hypothetical protein KC19_8G160300 [Ceratodon purpureus]
MELLWLLQYRTWSFSTFFKQSLSMKTPKQRLHHALVSSNKPVAMASRPHKSMADLRFGGTVGSSRREKARKTAQRFRSWKPPNGRTTTMLQNCHINSELPDLGSILLNMWTVEQYVCRSTVLRFVICLGLGSM